MEVECLMDAREWVTNVLPCAHGAHFGYSLWAHKKANNQRKLLAIKTSNKLTKEQYNNNWKKKPWSSTNFSLSQVFCLRNCWICAFYVCFYFYCHCRVVHVWTFKFEALLWLFIYLSGFCCVVSGCYCCCCTPQISHRWKSSSVVFGDTESVIQFQIGRFGSHTAYGICFLLDKNNNSLKIVESSSPDCFFSVFFRQHMRYTIILYLMMPKFADARCHTTFCVCLCISIHFNEHFELSMNFVNIYTRDRENETKEKKTTRGREGGGRCRRTTKRNIYMKNRNWWSTNEIHYSKSSFFI